jgi:hypothetical protein
MVSKASLCFFDTSAFVSTSAQLSSVEMYLTLISPNLILSWTLRNLTSTCFMCPEAMHSFSTVIIATLLSSKHSVGSFCSNPRPFPSCRKYRTSHVKSHSVTYSLSADDKVTIDYSLLFRLTNPLLRNVVIDESTFLILLRDA